MMRDEDIPRHWGTRDFYYEALRVGVTDPKAMCRALAALDAAFEISRQTGVDFAVVAELLMLGMVQYADSFMWVWSWKWNAKLTLKANLASWRWCARVALRRACVRLAARSLSTGRLISSAIRSMAAFSCRAAVASARKLRKGTGVYDRSGIARRARRLRRGKDWHPH